ncbi:MAG: 2-oxoacid:acceptor oxidoreductase family protein [bacterium]|jgi:2-oxoglutarate ferredoxin oxidoreductase subunit gamma
MRHEIISAGFGGQGVLLLGQLLAYAGMLEGKEVSWLPAYGPEMRGGTANCTVVISDSEIGSPVVSQPDCVIAMNLPSVTKFENSLRPGGILLVNKSLVDYTPSGDKKKVVQIAATEIADDLGNSRIANMVMLGALNQLISAVSFTTLAQVLKQVLPERRHNLIPLNIQAIERGAKEVIGIV